MRPKGILIIRYRYNKIRYGGKQERHVERYCSHPFNIDFTTCCISFVYNLWGGWSRPAGYEDIACYSWIAKISYSFFLEAFVAISGYIYAYYIFSKKKSLSLGKFILNKFKRLIVPSIIFGTVYYFIFYEMKSPLDAIISIVGGIGHLWFLPMLFWCFIGGWFLVRWNISDKYKIIFLLLLSSLSFVSLPLRINSAMYYMLFFYLGVCLQKRSKRIETMKWGNIISYWLAFAVVFVFAQKIIGAISGLDTTIIEKTIRFETGNILKIIYSALGSWALFLTSRRYVHTHELSSLCIKFSSCCFGVYIFQQFILQIIYYKTDIPALVGPVILPWLGFAVAMIVSLLLSMVFLNTKLGRKLI